MVEPEKKPRTVLAKETRQRRVVRPPYARLFGAKDDLHLVEQPLSNTQRHVLEQFREMLAMLNKSVTGIAQEVGFARRAEVPAVFLRFGFKANAFVQHDRDKGAGSRARLASGASAIVPSAWHALSLSMRFASRAKQALGADWVQIAQSPCRREHRSCPGEGYWRRARE